jgi:hypothetical protein
MTKTLFTVQNYKVEADRYCFILSREVANKKEPGKTYWVTLGYYGDLHQLLHNMYKFELKQTELTDLTEVCKKLDELSDKALEVVRGTFNKIPKEKLAELI